MDIRKMLTDGMARYIFQREATQPKPPRTSSKHLGGKRRPRNWHQKKRSDRKAQKLARRAQRGKR